MHLQDRKTAWASVGIRGAGLVGEVACSKMTTDKSGKWRIPTEAFRRGVVLRLNSARITCKFQHDPYRNGEGAALKRGPLARTRGTYQ